MKGSEYPDWVVPETIPPKRSAKSRISQMLWLCLTTTEGGGERTLVIPSSLGRAKVVGREGELGGGSRASAVLPQ